MKRVIIAENPRDAGTWDVPWHISQISTLFALGYEFTVADPIINANRVAVCQFLFKIAHWQVTELKRQAKSFSQYNQIVFYYRTCGIVALVRFKTWFCALAVWLARNSDIHTFSSHHQCRSALCAINDIVSRNRPRLQWCYFANGPWVMLSVGFLGGSRSSVHWPCPPYAKMTKELLGLEAIFGS